jgi:hypothetical protein
VLQQLLTAPVAGSLQHSMVSRHIFFWKSISVTTEEHWKFFAEFCHYDRLAGGPDPHMACIGHMAKDCNEIDRIWYAGCYIGVYNVPTAEVIFNELSWSASPQLITTWVDRHWDGLSFRRERRAVRSRAKLAKYLISYSEWMRKDHAWWDGLMSPTEAYEAAWRDVHKVYGIGRYVALKLLEFFQRYCDAPIELPDMRPSGGWSPREALALLYPEHAMILKSSDPRLDVIANHKFEEARVYLELGLGVSLDRYNMQVLLCDYKQSVIGKRQYPGRSQDSELDYAREVHSYFGEDDTTMWETRKAIFPHWALGELNGWEDVRSELGNVLADYKYTWSDAVYSWRESKDNLAKPVVRDMAATA